MDLNFAIIQKMSVIHKAIYKGPLKCWNVVITLPCGTNFNEVQLCLNNPKPKKCTLLCQHISLSLQGGKVSPILFPHTTAKCGFQVPRLDVSGSEAKLKVEPGLPTLHGLNQNFPYVIRHIPSCHAMQVGKGEEEFKKKKIKKWHLAKFSWSEKLEPLRETNVWNC